VHKRDLYEDYVSDADGSGDHIRIQKMLIPVCPCVLRLHVLKDEFEGGYGYILSQYYSKLLDKLVDSNEHQ